MSIFKTNLSVESNDQSTPIKFTTSYNNDPVNPASVKYFYGSKD